jgi:DNA (cytosine-5)-methyltransferase 1
MKFLSVCSGIEAASCAWDWEAVAFSEIEKFPSQVLSHHYPETPNWGDMTKFKEWPDANVDVLVGGTPCQSFSIAGLRKGLDDPRGNLMLTYLAIASKYRPKWVVWENVPGVLSSNGGLDFASFLRGLGECGYGFAYRVLDAQYFGVPQRRRRVFVVGCLGDWRSAAAVLFEQHSLQGHLAPSRKKGESFTETARKSAASSRWPADISSTLDTTFGTKQGLEDQHVNAGCPMFVSAEMTTVQTLRTRRPGEGGMSHDHEHLVPTLSPALNTCSGANHAPDTKAYIVQPTYSLQGAGVTSQNSQGSGWNEEVSFTLNRMDVHGVAVGTDVYNGAITGDVAATMGTPGSSVNASGPTVMQSMAVRRLTPMECERLQGFPDGYTDIKLNGKPTPDGPRYKALGNSMAVPVMRWIGQRIEAVDRIK